MRPARTCGGCRSRARRCCARCARPSSGSAKGRRLELRQASSLDDVTSNAVLLAGGTELVPLLRSGLVDGDVLVDIRRVVPHGIGPNRIGAGTTLAELECDPQIPDALREAARLAASPQLRNMGSLAGNLLQSTRCWYWRLNWPCRLHDGDAAARVGGETRVALAGVAPVPWLLDGELDAATPLPSNAYKVDVAKALVKRARAAVGV